MANIPAIFGLAPRVVCIGADIRVICINKKLLTNDLPSYQGPIHSASDQSDLYFLYHIFIDKKVH